MPDDLARYLIDAAEILSIPIDYRQSEQFLHYGRTLEEWNRTTNLTAIEDEREVVIKHFVDSIAPLRYGFPWDYASILDIGAGAGFPSIPLKIMRPDLRMTLLEPNSKKVSFLLHLVGTFQFKDVTVVGQTLKEFARQSRRHFDCALVRALSLITIGKDLANILSPDGMVLAYRSALMQQDDVPLAWMSQKEWSYELPFGYGHRVLALLELVKPDVPRGTKKLT